MVRSESSISGSLICRGTLAGLETRKQSGKARQKLCSELMGEGNDCFSSLLDEYNTEEVINGLLRHELDEYLDDVPDSEKQLFLSNYQGWMPLSQNGGWRKLKSLSDEGALIFTPHRRGYFGVTGEYVEKWNAEERVWTPRPNRQEWPTT